MTLCPKSQLTLLFAAVILFLASNQDNQSWPRKGTFADKNLRVIVILLALLLLHD
jgi:hypothetical protein